MNPKLACLLTIIAVSIQVKNAQADLVATSTISFDPLVVANEPIDSLVIEWSTPVMSGIVNESALSTLTFSIFNGSSLVYRDIAIQNGIAQPIGDVARGTDDFQFNFDVDAGIFVPPGNGGISWDNDVPVLQAGNTSGTTWNIYSDPVDQYVYLDRVVDGLYDGREFAEFTQSTVFAVPEPSSVALLTTVAIGFLARRRR